MDVSDREMQNMREAAADLMATLDARSLDPEAAARVLCLALGYLIGYYGMTEDAVISTVRQIAADVTASGIGPSVASA